MNTRSWILALGIGAVGATVNHRLARAGGELPPGVPGTTATYQWRGVDITYTTRGDPSDPDVVCLHDVGVVGAGREFRGLTAELAEDYHVIVPDLPGYGQSDHPPVRYSASLYQSILRSFIQDVTTKPTVIASGLTGSYAAEAATELEINELVLVVPIAETGVRSPGLETLFRADGIGTGIYNLLTTRTALQHRQQTRWVYDPTTIGDAWIEYYWQAAHQEGARYAPAARLSGLLAPGSDLETLLAAVDVPVTLLWGREATTVPLQTGRSLAERTDSRLLVVDYARTRPHIEYPTKVATALTESTPTLTTTE